MKKLAKILLLGLAMSATSAQADYIDGMLLIGGTYEAVGGGVDLAATTGVIITDAEHNHSTSVIAANTDPDGDSSGGVELSLGSFAPVDAFVVFDGWTLDIDTLDVPDITKTSGRLALNGTGTLWKAGFDVTPVDWTFSAESATSYSMSMVTMVVPVPAAVWLFGSGLIGLVGIARRKA